MELADNVYFEYTLTYDDNIFSIDSDPAPDYILSNSLENGDNYQYNIRLNFSSTIDDNSIIGINLIALDDMTIIDDIGTLINKNTYFFSERSHVIGDNYKYIDFPLYYPMLYHYILYFNILH